MEVFVGHSVRRFDFAAETLRHDEIDFALIEESGLARVARAKEEKAFLRKQFASVEDAVEVHA